MPIMTVLVTLLKALLVTHFYTVRKSVLNKLNILLKSSETDRCFFFLKAIYLGIQLGAIIL